MKVRLYIKENVVAGAVLALGDDQSHYLKAVLRRAPGDSVFIFNERDGEFEGKIFEVRRGVTVRVLAQVRPISLEVSGAKVSLALSVVKSEAFFDIITKAVELGVGRMLPLKTKHSIATLPRSERCVRVALEALEQCERMVPPVFEKQLALDQFLESLKEGDLLVFCNERAPTSCVISKVLPQRLAGIREVFILIGPEGGFSKEETEILLANKFTVEVSLGEGILRAPTAATCAIFGVNTVIYLAL